MLFAAGNNAERIKGLTSERDADGLLPGGCVSAPANAKNVLAVGATLNLVPATEGTAVEMALIDARASPAGEAAMTLEPTVSLDFGTHAPLYARPLRVVVAEPYLACQPLRNAAADVRGALVVVGRGRCNFSSKAGAVSDAGGAAMLIVNFNDAALLPGVNPRALVTPVSAVPLELGREILALLGMQLPENAEAIGASESLPRGGTAASGDGLPNVTVVVSPVAPGRPFEDVAEFSGYGPIIDGRIKPDLVAPGATLLSAYGRGPLRGVSDTCSMARLQGTSMATPVVAAAAAQVRQYFRAGYYPSGMRRRSDEYDAPSGMLVKAVLTAGAAEPTGDSALLGRRLIDVGTAGRFDGFGRVDLTRSLPLQGNLHAVQRSNLQVVDMVPIAEGDTHAYVLASSGGDVAVSLVWFDYPADVNAYAALVNDLDLVVEVTSPGEPDADGVRWPRTVSHPGNGVPGSPPDRVNTVERVVLRGVPPGARLRMTVTAASLPSAFLDPDTPQRYALAITGLHTGTLESPYNPAYRPPSPPVYPPPRQPESPPLAQAFQQV
eukprot:354169-Chlamydomonas_euryale.AAC.15